MNKMNKIISVIVFLLSVQFIVQAAAQSPSSSYTFAELKESLKLNGLKTCIDQLNMKVPTVKECYDKFDASNPGKTYDCVQQKFKEVADTQTVNECIPESVRNLMSKQI